MGHELPCVEGGLRVPHLAFLQRNVVQLLLDRRVVRLQKRGPLEHHLGLCALPQLAARPARPVQGFGVLRLQFQHLVGVRHRRPRPPEPDLDAGQVEHDLGAQSLRLFEVAPVKLEHHLRIHERKRDLVALAGLPEVALRVQLVSAILPSKRGLEALLEKHLLARLLLVRGGPRHERDLVHKRGVRRNAREGEAAPLAVPVLWAQVQHGALAPTHACHADRETRRIGERATRHEVRRLIAPVVARRDDLLAIVLRVPPIMAEASRMELGHALVHAGRKNVLLHAAIRRDSDGVRRRR